MFVADGLKAPKEGRKMPAVKKLHQESADNSKPEYIFGHSFQTVSLLVQGALGPVFSVPLASRGATKRDSISESDRRTVGRRGKALRSLHRGCSKHENGAGLASAITRWSACTRLEIAISAAIASP